GLPSAWPAPNVATRTAHTVVARNRSFVFMAPAPPSRGPSSAPSLSKRGGSQHRSSSRQANPGPADLTGPLHGQNALRSGAPHTKGPTVRRNLTVLLCLLVIVVGGSAAFGKSKKSSSNSGGTATTAGATQVTKGDKASFFLAATSQSGNGKT